MSYIYILERLIKTRELFSKRLISFQNCGWLNSLLAAQGARWDPPWTGCPPFPGHSHPYPHPLRLGLCRCINLPLVHIFGMWEKAGVCRKNPCGRGEMCKFHTAVALAGNKTFFFFFNQRYNEPTLNKTTFLSTCRY